MHPICESHPQVTGMSSGLRQIVRPPDVLPEPLVQAASPADASGASIYGSVIRDGGLFRMWYQAWPGTWEGGDAVTVGCLESDDGLEWRRPNYGLVACQGSTQNQLTDLPFHSPAVVLDPHATPAARFRAFGYSGPRLLGKQFDHPLSGDGFYTARSADGLHWELDGMDPVWPYGDVITAVWDPWADRVQIVLKRNGRTVGMHRRCFHTAAWDRGQVSEPAAAFIPDELDDVNARARGFVSADYYGVGLMPSAGPTLGFLWNFRHLAPLKHDDKRLLDYADIGSVDLSLVYQPQRDGRWLHLSGRPDWLPASAAPSWARGALYTASSAIDVGDETWLYFSGTTDQHGWCGVGADAAEFRRAQCRQGGFARIGLLKWPRHRLIGLQAMLSERLQLQARPAWDGQSGLHLNVVAGVHGSVRARLLDGKGEPVEGYGFEDCDPISGDHLDATVRWRGKSAVPARASAAPTVAELELRDATLFAFDYTME